MPSVIQQAKARAEQEQRAEAARRQRLANFGKTVPLQAVLMVEPVALELYGVKNWVVSDAKLAAELSQSFRVWQGEAPYSAIRADVQERLERALAQH